MSSAEGDSGLECVVMHCVDSGTLSCTSLAS